MLTFLLSALNVASATTLVPGGVLGTTTWDLAGSPYIVQGDVTIPAGATLTIEAGVEVRTASTDAAASGLDTTKVEIVIDGVLDVLGDAADPVAFVADTSTSSSAWYGIVVNAGGVVELTDARIERARFAIRSAGTLDLLGLDVSLGATAGLHLTGGYASVAASAFTSSTYGVHLTGASSLDLIDTRVFDTGSYGVYVNTTGSPNVNLDRLTVYSVGNTGVYVAPSSGSPAVTVTNAVLTHNSGWGVYRTGSGSTTVSYTDVWSNSSGTLFNVTQGAGLLYENPLYVGAPADLALTSNSPARFAADDGSDIGAAPYAGVATPGLYGVLWTNTTLPAGVHTVAGDLTVPAGVTLTLAPGAVFETTTTDLMGSHTDTTKVELRVAGTLFSVGTANNPVVMRSVGSSTSSWTGVRLLPTATTGLVQHTSIEEANHGIWYEATANNPIRDTHFERNSTAAIYINAGDPLIERITATGSSHGIRLAGSSAMDLRTSVIYDTGSYGVYVNTTGSPSIDLDNVTVYSAGNTGIYVAPSSGTPQVTITDAVITHNSGWGVYRTGSGTTTVSNTLVWSNSSGTLFNVTQGAGLLYENPLYVSPPTDLTLTEWSPARFAGGNGTDLGARPYDGDPTVGLQGTLWGGLALDLGGSPYTVVGDLTVPVGATLTIEPGVELLAATTDSMGSHADLNKVELRIAGTIDAVGTPYAPISLQSTGTSTSSWYGLHLLGTAEGEVAHVTIAEAINGVRHSAAVGVPLSFVHVERGSTAGVLVDGGAPLIDGLTVTGPTHGLRLTSGGAATVTNCAIWDTGSYGVYVNTTGNPTISLNSCTIHSVGNSGVYIAPSSGSPTVTVSNSLITSNSGWGVYRTGSGTTTVSYTDAWGNSSGTLFNVTQGAGILNTNPFYVDEPGRNFRLTATSPAIDAGTSDGAPDHDLTGRPRPVDGNGLGGAEYDLGAYEYRDEHPGVTATPGGTVIVAEAGGVQRLDLVLDAPPLANVILAVSGSDPSEGTVSPSQLTFTPLNWDLPQVLTVTGVDDDVDDGDVSWTITLDPSGSVDLEYRVIPATVLDAQTVDDDTAALVLTNTHDLRTSEVGGTDTFTVALGSEPVAAVRVDLVSMDTEEGTVSPPAIAFDASNWRVPQTVTLTGVDDTDADGDQTWQVRIDPVLSNDAQYAALPAIELDVLNVDDETATPGISVFGGPLTTSEDGSTDAFNVVLDTAPTASVTIGVSSSDPGEATVSPTSLTFTTANWSVPQSVVATGVDDGDADGDQPFTVILAPAVSADADYNGLDPEDVEGTNLDDDRVEVIVTALDPRTSESGESTVILVRLGSSPSADVVVTGTSSDPGEGTVSGPITFTATTYGATQALIVTGVDDTEVDGDQTYQVQLTVTSADPAYAALVLPDIDVVNVDDDFPAIRVVGGPLETDERGGTDTFQVFLGSPPTADVLVPVGVDDPSEATASPVTLTFTAANYAAPQTVTVTGVDDTDVDGTQAFAVLLGPASSTDPAYDGLIGPEVLGTNRDDESPGVVMEPSRGLVVSESGTTDTLDIALFTQPTADVTLEIAISDETEAEVDLLDLTFTTVDWDVSQTVTITGLDDLEEDGDVPWTIDVIAVWSDDPAYADLAALGDVSAEGITLDDDGPGYDVNPTEGLVTSEGGGVATFTVALRTAPASEVYVVVNSSDPTEGVASPSVLTFGPGDFDVPQEVEVTGVDDQEPDGDIAYTVMLSATTADPVYAPIDPPDVSVLNLDDETDGTATTDTGGPTDTDDTDTTDTDTDTDDTETDGTDPGADGDGGDGSGEDKGGCGCATPTAPWAGFGVALVVLVGARRRRR